MTKQYGFFEQLAIGEAFVGGESGPQARWMLPDWVRQVQADCEDTNVPFFFKQMER